MEEGNKEKKVREEERMKETSRKLTFILIS